MLLLPRRGETPAFLKVIPCMQQLTLQSLCQHLPNQNAKGTATIYLFPVSNGKTCILPASRLPRFHSARLPEGKGGAGKANLMPGRLTAVAAQGFPPGLTYGHSL